MKRFIVPLYMLSMLAMPILSAESTPENCTIIQSVNGVEIPLTEWNIENTIANEENPGVIKLVPGQTQSITIQVSAPKALIESKPVHNMKAEISLPSDFTFICSAQGDQPEEKHSVKIDGSRIVDTYTCCNNMFNTGKRSAEWKSYKFAVRVPYALKAGSDKLSLTLFHDDKPVIGKIWRVELIKNFPQPRKLKRLRIGFWDYGNQMLEKAHPELIKFWKYCGINSFFGNLKSEPDPEFQKIGEWWHGYFETWDYPGIDYLGNKEKIGIDGSYLKEKNIREILPELIPQLVNNARESGSNWTGMDYEPTGLNGFLPVNIAEFKRKYQISDAEFDSMHNLLKKEDFKFWAEASRKQRETYKKWNEFQSSLHLEFVRQITAELKKSMPEAKFHNTTLDALPPPDIKGRGLGADASIMAKYLDMIEPQLYIGYDEVAVKFTMTRTAQWKKRIMELNPKCRLHPLLLVRYSSGKERNSAARLTLQTIGAFAEGAQGVSYYYIQQFNAPDWAAVAQLVDQLVPWEDFYLDGKRVDDEFTVSGAPERTGRQPQYPSGHNKVINPDWHCTAHDLNGKILVTFFNNNHEKEITFNLKTKCRFSSITGGIKNRDGSFTVKPEKIAYITFQR